jgi:hypothetical protein
MQGAAGVSTQGSFATMTGSGLFEARDGGMLNLMESDWNRAQSATFL